jgi:hypothetical protein
MWYDWRRRDPGPCPVDDTPHTACTATEAAAAPLISRTQQEQAVRVPFPRPGWLRAREQPGPAAQMVSEPFSTEEYTRAKHGPLIGKGKRRR